MILTRTLILKQRQQQGHPKYARHCSSTSHVLQRWAGERCRDKI